MDSENNTAILDNKNSWALPGDYNLPLQQLDVQSYNNTYRANQYTKSFATLNRKVKPLANVISTDKRIHTDNSSVSNDTFYEASPIVQQPSTPPEPAETAETPLETPSYPALYYPTLVEMPYSPVVDVDAKPHMDAPLTNDHAIDLGSVADPKVNLQLAGPLCNVPDMATADDETRLLHILEYEMEHQTNTFPKSTIWSVLSDFINFFFKPEYHTLYPWAKFTMVEPRTESSQSVDELDLDDIFISIYK